MRRWLIYVLIVLMPVQLTWAAAAPYCGHETTAAAADHVGHHEHQHDASLDVSPPADDGAAAAPVLDSDCAFCHLGASASVPAVIDAIALAPAFVFTIARVSAYLSHIPTPPERPDRVSTTAAVRFGGGVVPAS
jgi:hypothetical protein